QVQDDDELFKSIKLNVNEFVGKGNVADKFNIKCRYLKADERIDNK
ncbi:5235_t:CDS:1, partial [Rhizophagus irregularis]